MNTWNDPIRPRAAEGATDRTRSTMLRAKGRITSDDVGVIEHGDIATESSHKSIERSELVQISQRCRQHAV